MKYLIALSLLFFSCKEEPNKIVGKPACVKDSLVPLPKKENAIYSKENDSMIVAFDNDGNQNDYIKISVQSEIYDKDSIRTSAIKLDFSHNSILLKPIILKIVGYDKGSEWYISKGFQSDESKNLNSSFLTISAGYPACGYTQNNYLFYFDKNGFNLIRRWQSMADGSWGVYQEFVTEKDFDEKTSFYSRMVHIEPVDENEKEAIISYSDSVHYFKEKNSWKTEYITVKDSVYRQKKINLEAF
jgi:hypothetical protein